MFTISSKKNYFSIDKFTIILFYDIIKIIKDETYEKS